MVILDQLGRQRGHLLRIGLLLGNDVLDGTAIDPTVVVDTVEIGLGHTGDAGEVGPRLLGDDGAQLDRRPSCLLTAAEAALRAGLRGGTTATGRNSHKHGDAANQSSKRKSSRLIHGVLNPLSSSCANRPSSGGCGPSPWYRQRSAAPKCAGSRSFPVGTGG